MVNKYTQGNWYVEEDSYSGHCCFSHSILSDVDNGSGFKAQVAEIISSCSEAEADAMLISAAPDLHAALVAITNALDFEDLLHNDQRAAFNQAMKALAKVNGEAT